MKTLQKVPMELVEVEFIPKTEELEFGKFYYSKEYNVAVHLCPCGCGMKVPIPIEASEWQIQVLPNGKFNVIPSLLQRFGCKSHYVITNSIARII